MKLPPVWRRVEEEMLAAETSRRRGNEGRARVCARRAAGAGLAAWWAVEGTANALELLTRAASEDEFPQAVRQAAERLTVRVNQGHRLPHVEDPLEDARVVLRWLGFEQAAEDGRASEGRVGTD